MPFGISSITTTHHYLCSATKESSLAYLYQGGIFLVQENWTNAEVAFRKAIAFDPNAVDAYANLGRALDEQDKPFEAIGVYLKANQMGLGNSELYINLGNALHKTKQLEIAAGAYQEAIKRDPNNADAYYNLGVVLQDQNKTMEAIAAYQKNISLNPSNGEAYNNLGTALVNQGKIVEAIDTFKSAIKINPNKANTRSVEFRHKTSYFS